MNVVQIECQIAQIEQRIISLNSHRDHLYDEIMRNQDLYIEGYEVNLGKVNSKLQREMRKTEVEIDKLSNRLYRLQKKIGLMC
jgi:SMC interacting uncharacterized protein involved in chromosome segregation